jgi:1-acyl-sn-glycerol-3-phosphate acyltransferase
MKLVARFIRMITRWSGRTIPRLCWGMRIEGYEHLPLGRAYIVAATHESFLDPYVVGCAPPRIKFIARGSLFHNRDGTRNRFMTWMRDVFRIIEVDRERGGRAGLRAGVEQIEAGWPLLVFPEGTRSPDGVVQDFKPGIGMIALRTGVPVVPCSIDGTRLVWGKGRKPSPFGGPVRITFGEPTIYEKPMKAKDVAADIRDRILALRGRAEPAARD